MSFSEIIGHTKHVDALRQALLSGRLHHAYIFAGPEGVGKRTLALALAKSIHCDSMDDDSCGTCGSCLAIQKGTHADVHVVEPLNAKKEISIQQVRELEKTLTFRSFSGKMKIAIIDPATAMNWPAQNALLKTLEEPPKDCLLILIASSAGGLLPTLRSRAFGFSFAALPKEVMAEFLISRRGKAKDQAEFLAALTLGSLGVLGRLENEDLVDRRRRWLEMLLSLTPGNYGAALEAAEGLAANRDDTVSFLEWAGVWYRDLLTFRVAHRWDDIVNLDMQAQIEQQAATLDEQRLFTLLATTAEASRRINRNMNRRMVLENLFLEAVEKH